MENAILHKQVWMGQQQGDGSTHGVGPGASPSWGRRGRRRAPVAAGAIEEERGGRGGRTFATYTYAT